MSDKVNILDVKVSRYDLQETIERFSKAIKSADKLRVSVTPVNCLLWAKSDEKLKNIYNSADIVTADGVPVVWASKLLGEPIKGRVTGLDLLPQFASVAAKEGFTFFFLGASEGVGEKLAKKLQHDYPGLKVSGIYSPPFTDTFSDDENSKMIELVNKAEADVLWVSLTAPKQDYWIAEHFNKLNVSVAVGVGAAFDVVCGNIKRAPEWMQNAGLEWLFRFSQEPKRLFRRYFIEAPQFVPLVFKQKLQTKKRL
ncbi:MAG: WecB/TagA/CpsF family glycosyltransferase [Balneolaceae bacterium]|nr:WecB/TagA/CpsF family glycosyltransferase [Balneolaceae bacterium]